MINLSIGGATKRSKFTAKAVDIDWDALPEASKSFAINYGLKQYIADGVAGALDQVDFDEGIAARIANLSSGDFSRKGGEGGFAPTNDPKVLGRKLAAQEVRERVKASGKVFSKEQVAAAIEKLFTSNEEKYVKEAQRQIDLRKEQAQAINLDELMG
jgi:hypothetical protein